MTGAKVSRPVPVDNEVWGRNLRKVVALCMEEMVPPLNIICVGPNGVFRITEVHRQREGAPEGVYPLAVQLEPTELFAVPLTVLIVDQEATSLVMVVDDTGNIRDARLAEAFPLNAGRDSSRPQFVEQILSD